MAMRISGPADQAGYYNLWLKGDALFDNVFMSNVNIHPFTDDYDNMYIPTMSYLAWYGCHLLVHPGKVVNRNSVLIASWADLMGPCLPETRILDEDDARRRLVNVVKELMKPEISSRIGNITSDVYVSSGEARTIDTWNRINRDYDDITPHAAMDILMFIAEQTSGAFSIGGVSMIINVYLAVLKRGNMSTQFISKIEDGLVTDLQVQQINIDADVCRLFYNTFGERIDDTTIQEITARWSNLLPQSALRLRLTVQQAAGSGLTALSVTGRAIRILSDFDWTRISQIYQDEWVNFSAAVALVGNNQWYGFKKNMGIVVSTKYKNLSYVAKELLIKVQGESSLRAYGGWTRKAKYQDMVDQMIATYEAAKTASITEGIEMVVDEESNDVSDLRAMITEYAEVYA